MDAFVDFHYVTYGGGRTTQYFINELHYIVFDPDTKNILYSQHATFKNPTLKLNHYFKKTFNYGYKYCHGMALSDGNKMYNEIHEHITRLKSCSNIFVKGSIKRRELARLLEGVKVHNTTTIISKISPPVNNTREQNNSLDLHSIRGYVTFSYIRSKYPSSYCCEVHKKIENGDVMCIANQCHSTFSWFMDNYYQQIKNTCLF